MLIRFDVDQDALDMKFKNLLLKLEDKQEEFLNELAGVIVTNSPVYTGTFMESLEVSAGAVGGSGSMSSHGKTPQPEAWQHFADIAMGNLSADISSLGDAGSITFLSNAEHATIVEANYAPFAIARNVGHQLAQEVFSRGE